MPIAQTTGVRGLQSFKLTQAFVEAKAQNSFIAEVEGSLNGENLFKVAKQIDQVAAKQQNARWRQEHTDAYCLARDFRYGRRSRKWLFAKAIRTRFDSAYTSWSGFVQENILVQPDVAQLTKQDINKLVNESFSEVLPA